jgi:hypothetical protein
MPDLKLAKLPDRTPVRIAVTVKPELHAALQNYAILYRQTYGEAESVAELIPYMLESFLESDRSFAKAMKEGEVIDVVVEASSSRPRRRRQQNTPEQAGEAPN